MLSQRLEARSETIGNEAERNGQSQQPILQIPNPVAMNLKKERAACNAQNSLARISHKVSSWIPLMSGIVLLWRIFEICPSWTGETVLIPLMSGMRSWMADKSHKYEPLAKVSLTAHHSILDARAFWECCMRCCTHRIHTSKPSVSQKRLMPNGLRRMCGIFMMWPVSPYLRVCT